MTFSFNNKDFDLDFATASYMALKKELACKDLRRTLLNACRDEDLDVLAKTIKRFSGEAIKNEGSAYACIDSYCRDHEMRRKDLFLKVVEEIGENGFFGEPKTASELEQMISEPVIDMDCVMEKAIHMVEEELVAEAVKQVRTPAGVTTLTT